MDLHDVSATLEDQVAQSNIRLFLTSSQVIIVDLQDNEEGDSEDNNHPEDDADD